MYVCMYLHMKCERPALSWIGREKLSITTFTVHASRLQLLQLMEAVLKSVHMRLGVMVGL